MATRNSLTAERLRELLIYRPDTGFFHWRVNRGGAKQGDIAGSVSSHGYRRLCIDCIEYRAARIAWLYMHGTWPTKEIDHADRQKTNNVFSNLREVTHKKNLENRGIPRNNQSGILGVIWLPKKRLWSARIKHNGKTIYLGAFKKIHDAANARKKGEFLYFSSADNIG